MSGEPSFGDAIPNAPTAAPTASWYAQEAPFPATNPWWPDNTQNQYAMTFANDTGESAFGPWSSPSGDHYALAYLVDLPLDPDGSATQRNIYRRSQTQGYAVQPAVLVGTLYDNKTTEFQEEEPPPPTPAQQAWATANIQNQMDWLNHVHDYLQDVIDAVYAKVSEDPTQDPGTEFAANVIDDALWGLGNLPFPGSGFVAAALANIFWGYVTDTPPSLQGEIGDVWDRFGDSFLQAAADLAAIHDDIPGNWSRTWTNPTTGETSTAWTMASPELAVPGKYSELYQTMTDVAKAGFYLALTKTLLPQRWFVLKDPKGVFFDNGDTPPATYIENVLSANWSTFVSYYFTWETSTGPNLCQQGIWVAENFLGTGTDDPDFATHAPADLCDWLFQDDGYGRITNSNGLATRHDVFCNWGLQNSLPAAAPNCNPYGAEPPTGDVAVTDLAAERRRARQWHALFARTDRQAVERRVIERARADPAFLRALVKEPKATIEAFLELRIPDGIEFEVIQETPGHFMMVLPFIGAPDGKPESS